jgi:putative hydrolase of the HAD superfamily
MKMDVTVIAFDIDGTLYPEWRLYIRLIPYFFRHFSFFLHYSRVRKILHRTAPLPDFFEYQSRLLAEELHCTVSEAKDKIRSIIYDGLRPYFKKIKPFRNVAETFDAFKTAGYKIALLSDFPPEQKGDLWGLIPRCDLILGTEQTGALKPSKYPFGIMARILETPLEKILYVGNSVHYDVDGAKAAGMKCAYLLPLWRRILHTSYSKADVCFSNYRQLKDIVLQ